MKTIDLSYPELHVADLAACRHQVERLPLTMRPTLYQQLKAWNELFPYEQNRLLGFVEGIRSLQPDQLDRLTRSLRSIETRMDVKQWDFSANTDTMENASLLARSPYYAEWRNEVQKVFSAIESAAPAASPESKSNRLILIILPDSLPISSITGGKPWDRRAIELRIDGDARRIGELAIAGSSSLPAIVSRHAPDISSATANSWLIDADAVLGAITSSENAKHVSLLDYETLKSFRDEFLRQVNTVPKDIHTTDQILAKIRTEDWNALWPASLKGQNRLRHFVTEVFLSGNGALIFSNAFVQWAASEALRRARPRLMVTRFGLRTSPKPFTSIAIFENQGKISSLKDVPDPEGSAIDARILARYIWLTSQRFPERARTLCVCVSESSRSAYVVPPEENTPELPANGLISPVALSAWMASFLSAQPA